MNEGQVINKTEIGADNTINRFDQYTERELMGCLLEARASSGAIYIGYFIGTSPRGLCQIRVVRIIKEGVAQGYAPNSSGTRCISFQSVRLLEKNETHVEMDKEGVSDDKYLGREMFVTVDEEAFLGVCTSKMKNSKGKIIYDVRPKGGKLKDLSGHLHDVQDAKLSGVHAFYKTRIVDESKIAFVY